MIITPFKPVSNCSWSPWNDGMAMQSCVGLSPKSGEQNAGEGYLRAHRAVQAHTGKQPTLLFIFCFVLLLNFFI